MMRWSRTWSSRPADRSTVTVMLSPREVNAPAPLLACRGSTVVADVAPSGTARRSDHRPADCTGSEPRWPMDGAKRSRHLNRRHQASRRPVITVAFTKRRPVAPRHRDASRAAAFEVRSAFSGEGLHRPPRRSNVVEPAGAPQDHRDHERWSEPRRRDAAATVLIGSIAPPGPGSTTERAPGRLVRTAPDRGMATANSRSSEPARRRSATATHPARSASRCLAPIDRSSWCCPQTSRSSPSTARRVEQVWSRQDSHDACPGRPCCGCPGTRSIGSTAGRIDLPRGRDELIPYADEERTGVIAARVRSTRDAVIVMPRSAFGGHRLHRLGRVR